MELKSFTRNYEDNSSDAGFQFTFYCDICNNGFKSSFKESKTYKKKSKLETLSKGANILGGFLGGFANKVGSSLYSGGNVLSQKFENQSPEWRKEYETIFNEAQEEVKNSAHFKKCTGCNKWVCPDCFNEEEGMCTECTPRENVLVTKAKSQAMQRNINEKADTETVWNGKIETKVVNCPKCGKPAGSGKFCQSCGANLQDKFCTNCGKQLTEGAKFCGECGTKCE